MKFFGRAGAADDVPPLEHERFQTSVGEVVSGDQAVVAGADDDDVVLFYQCR